jgi:hypothetical protein
MHDADLLAQRLPDNEQRFDQLGQIGIFSTSSWIRASNFLVATAPTLRPKLRKVARRSFSTAMAFACSSLRWVSQHAQFLTA